MKSTKFCEYVCTKVLPHLQSIADQAAQARVLKLLAELAENIGMFDAPLDATQKIYNCLRVCCFSGKSESGAVYLNLMLPFLKLKDYAGKVF